MIMVVKVIFAQTYTASCNSSNHEHFTTANLSTIYVL